MPPCAGHQLDVPHALQVAILLPQFIFCYYMYEWETDEANQARTPPCCIIILVMGACLVHRHAT